VTSAQLRAIPVALLPLVLVVSIITIPVVTDYSNHELAALAVYLSITAALWHEAVPQ
jgi:hypothetical protein